MPFTEQDCELWLAQLPSMDWKQRLAWIARQDGKKLFSTSFGLEDQMLTDVIAKATLPIELFTLDTGRLFEETYQLQQETTHRYGLNIHTFYPDPDLLQEFVTYKGINSFYQSVENRKECCFIRKVEPLRRALRQADIWISGLRHEQSDNRQALPIAEWDHLHNLIKCYPLIDVTQEDMLHYIAQYNVPVNSLHANGFPSIGCAPCTRAVQPGEHPRAGRWWWEGNSAQECGLHVVDGKLVPLKPQVEGEFHAY